MERKARLQALSGDTHGFLEACAGDFTEPEPVPALMPAALCAVCPTGVLR